MKIAAFTMAHNENVFLPLWLKYYEGQFGRSHCYILDHGSQDGSTSGLGWNCLRIPSSSLDETSRASLVGRFQRFLLSSYDAVLFADTDEILVADPKQHKSLSHFVEQMSVDRVAGVGLALTHAQDIESEIDLTRPILSQRRFARFQDLYCKPLIVKKETTWSPGFHSCNEPFSLSRNLFLFHIKAFDMKNSMSELARRRSVTLSERSIALGQNYQFKFSDQEIIDTYFPLKGDDFPRRSKLDFSFESHLIAVAQGRLSRLEESFKETYELPDRLRLSF